MGEICIECLENWEKFVSSVQKIERNLYRVFRKLGQISIKCIDNERNIDTNVQLEPRILRKINFLSSNFHIKRNSKRYLDTVCSLIS